MDLKTLPLYRIGLEIWSSALTHVFFCRPDRLYNIDSIDLGWRSSRRVHLRGAEEECSKDQGENGGVGVGRPPVPPKPRTLSQTSPPRHSLSSFPSHHPSHNSSAEKRGVVDDRDGYLTSSGNEGKKLSGGMSGVSGGEEKKKRGMHERWLPSALLGMSRPATSQGVRGE